MEAEIRLVYVTTPDQDIARAIAWDVVAGGLAACANILPGMESLPCRQGKLEQAAETVLTLKCCATGCAVLTA